MSDTVVHLGGSTWKVGERRVFNDAGEIVTEPMIIINAHSSRKCMDEVCVLHHPTDHHMSSWELCYRVDRNIVERLCPLHGIGHPDPDQWEYWRKTDRMFEQTHGCCGCCSRP